MFVCNQELQQHLKIILYLLNTFIFLLHLLSRVLERNKNYHLFQISLLSAALIINLLNSNLILYIIVYIYIYIFYFFTPDAFTNQLEMLLVFSRLQLNFAAVFWR